jgi:DNA (cytosine-5)-methyltransferase 1
MPNHASTSMCHPDELRVLSVAECASIQEFPPGWTFVGTPMDQYRQVGNAVPARLGAIAGQVVSAVFDEPVVDADAPPYRLTYVKSHVRTRKWYSDGQAVVRVPAPG